MKQWQMACIFGFACRQEQRLHRHVWTRAAAGRRTSAAAGQASIFRVKDTSLPEKRKKEGAGINAIYMV